MNSKLLSEHWGTEDMNAVKEVFPEAFLAWNEHVTDVCFVMDRPRGNKISDNFIDDFIAAWADARSKLPKPPIEPKLPETRTVDEEMRIARSKWWDYALDKPMNVFGAFEAGFKAAWNAGRGER